MNKQVLSEIRDRRSREDESFTDYSIRFLMNDERRIWSFDTLRRVIDYDSCLRNLSPPDGTWSMIPSFSFFAFFEMKELCSNNKGLKGPSDLRMSLMKRLYHSQICFSSAVTSSPSSLAYSSEVKI
jgi:hypothetical protein